MLSPESLARSHKRHVTDVVRVAIERRGILGFIETHESMTLREARQHIWENVEHAPCDFQFVLDDGVPVSARQENTQRVMQFYPCLKIREYKKPISALVVTPTKRDDGGAVHSNSSTEKISVWTSSGDEFTVWISEDYTFQQLRRDAARYWNLPAGQVALADRDGCLWPEQAKILSVMGVQELLDRKIVLESKAGATSVPTAARPRSTAIALARTVTVIPSRRRLSTGDATMPNTMASWHDTLSHHAEVVNPVEELWRVFTFYCVNGDSLELECIRAHQFNRLLRDAQVLGPAVTPAMADIIYTSETKGKPQASGKMNFDEFLSALIKVALARHRKGASHKLLQRTAAADTREQDELFQQLVAECILPRASRWPTHAWDLQTQQLRHADIVELIAKFLDPLLDLFAFYAKSHLLQTSTGVKQFHMAYTDYQRFINDFALANLQISSVEAAQVFVASCASTPVHDALSGEQRDTPMSPRSSALESQYDCDVLSCSSLSSSSSFCSAGMSVASAFHKLVQSAEGVVLFLTPAAQVGRLCMSFSAFLDTMGRLGLVAFAKTKAGKLNALQSVKAVFQHMSRGLTRSRVLDIVATHGSASIHAGRFYSGSVAFNNRFLDMWRYEGSPDYLAVGVSEGGDLSGDITATMPLIPVAAGKKGPEAMSPSRRLVSSAALVDERVVLNGAGRGREALDRLVRNAFIRNAVASTSSISSTAVMETQLTKENSITLATPSGESGSSPPPEDERTQRHPPVLPTHEPCEAVEPPASVGGDARPTPPPLLTPDKPAVLRPYVSGGLPLHPHDERSLFESILLKGGVFKKYGQWGNPHRRFVWCTKEFDGVCWRPINKKHSLTKDGLAAASLVAVLPGNSQRTRYAFMKHLSDEKSLSRCLSLVAEDRRLDLEADSEATRDLWMQALQFLIRDRRARTSVPTA